MADAIQQFIDDLAGVRHAGLFNPYGEAVDGFDRPGAAATRRENLRTYLVPRVGAPLALIGEAPSAHGARFSGIAFTSERSLPSDRRTSDPILSPRGFTEHSATIVERSLASVGLSPTAVLLWNVVPFHPMGPTGRLTNRRPAALEIAAGKYWLGRFLKLMHPGRVVAVGKTAAQALPWNTTALRHPAYGGARQFQFELQVLAANLQA